MHDHLIRITSEAGDLRAIACVTTNLVNDACKKHQTTPVATAAFARALSGGALMSALIKGDQRLALKFEGDGPIRKIVVEVDADGGIRGTVGNPEVALLMKNGQLDVAGALGSVGLLTVVRDLGLKQPVSGTVHLVSGEIGQDLAYYFAESEQIPATVGVGAYLNVDGTVAVSGGFLIQTLPPSNPASIESIITMIESLPPLTTLLREGNSPEDILKRIFSEVPYSVHGETPLVARCNCSRERFERALMTLGLDEMRSMAAEEKDGIETRCEFCKTTYAFGVEDLEKIVKVLTKH